MSLFRQKFVVEPGHVLLTYRDGALDRVLRPGVHKLRSADGRIVVDMRERLIQVAPQEVLTSDVIPVRVSMVMRLAVVDAEAFTEKSADPIAMVYLAAQVALRKVCAELSADDLIGRGDALDVAPIRDAAAQTGVAAGIEVLDVLVKDVIMPGELRAAAVEAVTAKTRGLAKLEAARAETAALRALANAGRLLDAHPALARLRLVEAAPYGAKVVLALGDAEASSTDD